MKYTYAILGGTGHIGSALALLLIRQGHSVLVIGHNEEQQKKWTALGAGFQAVEITDSERLKTLLNQGERLFILNPPADPAKDAEVEELKYIERISKAIEGLRPKKIVMASTYGARKGKGLFDLSTLYELEQELKQNRAPLAIIRSAYYMSNLDLPAKMAAESGKLTTVLPADFKLPMVAPADIAGLAAKLLQDDRTGTYYVQAKEEYSARDAAKVLSNILHRDITPDEIPEGRWAAYMQENGFSERSTESFIGMTKLTIEEKFEPADPQIGETTLEQYLKGIQFS